MDAKPHRPMRASHPPANDENIQTFATTKLGKTTFVEPKLNPAGFKMPARRVVFGDRTNASTNVAPTSGKPMDTIKRSFLPSWSRESQPITTVLPSQPLPTIRPTTSQAVIKESKAGKATVVYRDQAVQQPLQAGIASVLGRSLSRRHKSQPSLRDRPVSLRRTQSKQFERPSIREVQGEETEPAYEDAVEHFTQEDEQPEQTEIVETHTDTESAEEPQHASRPLPALPIEYEDTEPEPAHAAAPEQYYEEEEEEYYDDQRYTTGSTRRSVGETTNGGATTILLPRRTTDDILELDEAQMWVDQNLSFDDLEDELADVNMVAEYRPEIFSYMRELEATMLPDPHYILIQSEMRWSMRSVLMEWVVQVHSRLNLLPETLFLAVNFIDRFLSKKVVSLGKLQLVGATALFVAAKYEEVACPGIDQIIFMVDNAYTATEIFKAERFMLQILQFDLGYPGPMSFLRLISKADDYELETRTLAKYLLEVTIMDERFIGLPSSLLAAASHCLARQVLGKGHWTLAHVHYSQYTWSQIEPLVKVIFECCKQPRTHHAAVYEKYITARYRYAALQVESVISEGFDLDLEHDTPVQSPLLPQQQAIMWPGCFDYNSQPMQPMQHFQETAYYHHQQQQQQQQQNWMIPSEG